MDRVAGSGFRVGTGRRRRAEWQQSKGGFPVAKKKSAAREFLWLQCTETGDLNYRTSVNTKGGMPEGLKEGMMKYCPRLRRHSLHKVKRK